ncbi:hypothetical protein KAR48_01045 [bacterium]|nr:hypothetical protein [bacterium]
MSVIKKKDSNRPDMPEIKDWNVEQSQVPISKIKRILKGEDIPVVPMSKVIPYLDIAKKGPYVEPLIEGDMITGVVVTCKCGERTTLHFDYDNANE